MHVTQILASMAELNGICFQCLHRQQPIIISVTNTVWLHSVTWRQQKKTADVFSSMHFFLLISRIFQATFTCLFLIIIKIAFIIHMTLLWCTHEIDSPSLHSCGIFPKNKRFNPTINLKQNPKERTEQYCCNPEQAGN